MNNCYNSEQIVDDLIWIEWVIWLCNALQSYNSLVIAGLFLINWALYLSKLIKIMFCFFFLFRLALSLVTRKLPIRNQLQFPL